ncbi:MAG: DUF4922 domain-containing protein [Bacteroidetes bacterium]|nr:DUF4922 domain-containing protein [Bacteroidota bacterium]
MSESRIITNENVLALLKVEDYVNAAKQLLRLQRKDWSQLDSGYKNLTSIKTKSFWFDGFKIGLQFNQGRFKSTSAKVDADTIQNRKCFLCDENLPIEQKGIKILPGYILLSNPYPVFPEHFTIVSIIHKPQEILSSFNDLIKISKILSGGYSLIYNGPRCGASAPDHLHFQAGTKQFMPIENDFHSLKNEFGEFIFEDEIGTITVIDDGLRRFISLETNDENMLSKIFNRVYKIYTRLNSGEGEPMLNIICNYYEDYGWNVIIFLRSKHRSFHYYLEEENRILLSPAAIDLGGVCITPAEKDYEKIDKELLKNILSEVSLNKESLEYIKTELKKEFG